MTTYERLARMEEIKAHNDAKVAEYIEQQRVENIHRTIEIYARAAFEAVNDLAGGNGPRCAELIDLLHDTLNAMWQANEQEGKRG